MPPTQPLKTTNQGIIPAGPLNGSIDPEALQGIELTAARESRTKHDDPYLICFDATFDAEKCANSN